MNPVKKKVFFVSYHPHLFPLFFFFPAFHVFSFLKKPPFFFLKKKKKIHKIHRKSYRRRDGDNNNTKCWIFFLFPRDPWSMQKKKKRNFAHSYTRFPARKLPPDRFFSFFGVCLFVRLSNSLFIFCSPPALALLFCFDVPILYIIIWKGTNSANEQEK